MPMGMTETFFHLQCTENTRQGRWRQIEDGGCSAHGGWRGGKMIEDGTR